MNSVALKFAVNHNVTIKSSNIGIVILDFLIPEYRYGKKIFRDSRITKFPNSGMHALNVFWLNDNVSIGTERRTMA